MKLGLGLFLICYSSQVLSQSEIKDPCPPSTSIQAMLCPDSALCPCPWNATCPQRVGAVGPGSKNITVISFKLLAENLAGVEEKYMESDNIGNSFTPKGMFILSRVQTGSVLTFTCIKAKNKEGQILILQPFTIKAKMRE